MEDISLTSTGQDPQSTEILASAGQVVIDEAYISSGGTDYDITNFMVSFILYEDMYSPFLTGNATLVDAASLITKIKPYGAEYITVSFRTRQGVAAIKKSFNIFSIKDRGPTQTDREQAYTLHFTSGENVINNNIAISRKYTGSTDQIVEKIYTEFLSHPRYVKGNETFGTTPIVVTGGPHRSQSTFVANFWSPAQCINHMATIAVGSKGNAPNYLFFETNKNFFFASIEDLIASQRDSNQIFASYVYSPSQNFIQNITDFTYQFPEIGKGYSIVRSIGAFNMYDTVEGQDRGFYGSTIYTYDMIVKEHRRFAYNHSDGYQRFNHMQDYSLSGGSVSPSKDKNTRPFGVGIFNGIDSKRLFRTKQYDIHKELRDPLYQTWLPQRNSLLSQMSQTKIVIEVAGRSDVEVGKLVNFLYPKMTSSDKFQIDPQVSGLYMITAVKHGVTRQQYSMTLELTKDSFMEPL